MAVTVELGDQAKDLVTGFEGVCVARTQWLNGCVRVSLQAVKLNKEGAPQDAFVFDEPQCVVTKRAQVKVDLAQVIPEPVRSHDSRTGGPIPAPKRADDKIRSASAGELKRRS